MKSDMGGLLGGLQQQMKAMQEQAERAEVEGVAAGGLVRVRMNGAQEVLAVTIDPKALGDAELLEDPVCVYDSHHQRHGLINSDAHQDAKLVSNAQQQLLFVLV